MFAYYTSVYQLSTFERKSTGLYSWIVSPYIGIWDKTNFFFIYCKYFSERRSSITMNYYFYGLCVFGVLLSLIENGRAMESRRPTWGDVGGAYLFQDRVTKSRIPLFTRSATFEYPVVCWSDISDDSLVFLFFFNSLNLF